MASSQIDLAPVSRTPRRTELNDLPGLDLHALYYTARRGGNFFDALQLGSRVAFLLADIAGRREEAQTIAAQTQDIFRRRASELLGAPDTNLMDATAQLVQEINHTLIRASHGVHFAPAFVGCYDLQIGILAYINAGGQIAAFRDSDGTRLLPNVTVPMGLFTHLTYEPSIQAFEPGARLLIVTKGVVECRRGGTPFGAERVLQLLQNSGSKSATEICRSVLQATHDFQKVPWYSIHNLHPGSCETEEDMTALAMVRTFSRK